MRSAEAIARTGRGSPLRRPSPTARAAIGVLATGVLLFNAVLMLADRAPRLLELLRADVMNWMFDRIDAQPDLTSPTGSTANDAIMHIGVWAVATVLVAMAFWTWRALPRVAAAVFAYSVAIELAQGPLSARRSVEATDVVFNAVGVGAAVALTAAVFVVTAGPGGARAAGRR